MVSVTVCDNSTNGGNKKGESHYYAYYSGFTAIIHCMFLPPYEVSVVIDGMVTHTTVPSHLGPQFPLELNHPSLLGGRSTLWSTTQLQLDLSKWTM